MRMNFQWLRVVLYFSLLIQILLFQLDFIVWFLNNPLTDYFWTIASGRQENVNVRCC